MSRRRGLTRLWIVGSALWCTGAAWQTDALWQMGYAIDYYTHRQSLETPEKAHEICEISKLFSHGPYAPRSVDRQEQESADSREAREHIEKRSGVNLARKIETPAVETFDMRTCVDQYKAEPPEWRWLAWILLPPTLGVLLLLFGGWAVVAVVRWVLQGFSAPDVR